MARGAAAGRAVRGLFAAFVLATVGARSLAGEKLSGDAPPVAFDARERSIIAGMRWPDRSAALDPTNRVDGDRRAAELGRRLFFDRRLSGGGDVSCATCHVPERAFTDGMTRRWEGMRHTPTLLGVASQRWFFWDGRADTLWSQALLEIEEPLEVRGDRLRAAHLVTGDPSYRRAFEGLFGALPDLSDSRRFPTSGRPGVRAWQEMDPVDRDLVNGVFARIGKVIAAYERYLVPGESPFDRFARGLDRGDPADLAAISPAARRGLKLFIGRARCRSCHLGPRFTDGEFHDIGVPPLAGRAPTDAGRLAGARLVLASEFNGTGRYSDCRTGRPAQELRLRIDPATAWGRFKTPTLRNVARTAPYMHQGQFGSLRDVVEFYSTRKGAVFLGHHQERILTPLNLTDTERADLVAFLETLTGSPAELEWQQPPASPTSPHSAEPGAAPGEGGP